METLKFQRGEGVISMRDRSTGIVTSTSDSLSSMRQYGVDIIKTEKDQGFAGERATYTVDEVELKSHPRAAADVDPDYLADFNIDYKFELGQKVRHIVNGFTGMVVGRITYSNQCHHYHISSTDLDKDQKTVSKWLASDLIEAVQPEPTNTDLKVEDKLKEVAAKPKKTGGPRHNGLPTFD